MRTEEGKNIREKVFYDFQDVLASAKKYQGFRRANFDDGVTTNWPTADGKLPNGHAMEIAKVGFFVRPAAGVTTIPLADFAKVVQGTYKVLKGEDELKSGTLAEFFPSFLVSGALPIINSEQEFSTCLLPLLQEEDWIEETITFEFSLPAGITVATMQISPVIKGVYQS